MKENLEAAYTKNGNLSVLDLALEVAFSGESWKAVCTQAEQVVKECRPGLYGRLRGRLGEGETLGGLTKAAVERVAR